MVVGFCTLLVGALVTVLAATFARFRVSLELEPQNLAGKLYLVTGCSQNGIGLAAAEQLLEWNATVICTMRTSKLDVLSSHNGTGRLHVVGLNLDSLASVRSAVEEITSRLTQQQQKLDGLVLNAGAIAVNYTVTKEDGFETTFQINHLSQFLLTHELLSRQLVKSGDGRVVFVSSGLHRLGGRSPEFESKPAVKLGAHGEYDCWNAYAHSKFFNVLSARAFAKRYPSVRVLSVSPGMVHTNIEDVFDTAPDAAMNKLMMSLLGRTVKKGAVRTVQALTSPQFASADAAAGASQHLDDYVQLPPFSLASEENADWLFDASVALLASK